MATIEESYNGNLCKQNEAIGAETGKTCIAQISATVALIATGVNDKFDKTKSFQEEYARLIKSGSLDIYKGVNTFEENGSEDASETLANDTQFILNEGLYKFLASFTNGMHFNKALHALKGFKNKRILLVTKEGVWGTKDNDGNLIGFTTGMIQPAKLTVGTFSSVQKEGLMFQFLEREELDENFVFIADAGVRKYTGVTQILLELVNAPADSDTTLTVKASYAQNRTVAFTGIDYLKFNHIVNGTTSNPTAGDDSTTSGTFPLTIAALSTDDKGQLSLYDNANNQAVIIGADGDYYRSNTVTYTV